MDEIIRTVIIGTLAGVIGTGLGGLIVAVMGRPNHRVLGLVLGFSGGIMLAIVFFDLLPEALGLAGPMLTLSGLVIGAILIAILDVTLPHTHFFPKDTEKSRFLRAGVILGLGITMHNLPEGLAIGTGYAVSEVTGAGLVLAMIIHDIPEGMAMAAPMIAGGLSPGKVVLFACLAGLPGGIGAYIGVILGNISTSTLSVSLGAAAGAMLYIVFDELIPGAQEMADRSHSGTLGAVIGVIAGLVLLIVLS